MIKAPVRHHFAILMISFKDAGHNRLLGTPTTAAAGSQLVVLLMAGLTKSNCHMLNCLPTTL
jgi:hypothetical protein